MRRFLSADAHFGHYNIIRFCGRPFKTVEEMNRALVERWNETVAPDDQVLYLGDFAYRFGDPEGLLRLFKSLHGRKTLLVGSHDKESLSLPWEQVVPILDQPIEVEGVLLAHEGWPLYNDKPGARTVFCGHVHEVWRVRGNMLNMGVDAWHFYPVAWYEAVNYWTHRWEYFQKVKGTRRYGGGES